MVSKAIISVKRLRKRIVSIFAFTLEFIGAMMLLAEAAYEVFEYNGLFHVYRQFLWPILLIVLFISIVKNWDRLSYTVRIKDSPDVTVTLKVCNIFKNKGAIIVPTNTTFDTLMDDEFISKGSIQGQYQKKYFNNHFDELDGMLEKGLEQVQYVSLKDGRETKTKRYPIGTVCRVSKNNKRAYFLADSDINEHGMCVDSESTHLSRSLVSLWDALATIGNNEPYSIPLLGTGKARVKDASREDVVKEIIYTFLAATRDHKITEKLIICIHPSDFEKIRWDDLCKYLEYQCKYSNHKPTQLPPDGTVEITPATVKLESEIESVEMGDESIDRFVSEGDDGSPLTESEGVLLLSLLHGNEMTINEMAVAMGYSIIRTKVIVNKLMKMGLIESNGNRERGVHYRVRL